MATLLHIPEIAANTNDATLVSWPLAENVAYRARDVIAVVETAKAVVDVEAESDGVILQRLVAEGTNVGVGGPIALIGAVGESVDDIDAVLSDLGYVRTVSTERAADGPAPRSSANGHPNRPPAAAANRVFASPLARRLARDAGLAVSTLAGTGPNGRILRRDVEQVIAAGAAAHPAGPSTAAPGSTTRPVIATAPSIATRHTRLRRAVADRLTESKQTVPHFYLRGTARVDRLLALRAELNGEQGPVRISVNDLVVKAVAAAHTRVPALNVVWTPDAVRSFDTVDVAVAVATERGLLTPVLRSVERSGIAALATTIRDLAGRAASGRLQQHELEGGTITVTNLGMFGTEEFAAIINPPHASILAVGAVRDEPIVVEGQVVAGSVMTVTLSVDHRPVDGAAAAEWMRTFVGLLENPARILAGSPSPT